MQKFKVICLERNGEESFCIEVFYTEAEAQLAANNLQKTANRGEIWLVQHLYDN